MCQFYVTQKVSSAKVVGGENTTKESSYKSYDDLPLFLNSIFGAPSKTQQSGLAGERRSNGTSEPCRIRRGEGCGVCDDEVVPKEQFIQWVNERAGGGV